MVLGLLLTRECNQRGKVSFAIAEDLFTTKDRSRVPEKRMQTTVPGLGKHSQAEKLKRPGNLRLDYVPGAMRRLCVPCRLWGACRHRLPVARAWLACTCDRSFHPSLASPAAGRSSL